MSTPVNAGGTNGTRHAFSLDGEDVPIGLGELDGMINGGIELELRHGGQPAYWWLLAAE